MLDIVTLEMLELMTLRGLDIACVFSVFTPFATERRKIRRLACFRVKKKKSARRSGWCFYFLGQGDAAFEVFEDMKRRELLDSEIPYFCLLHSFCNGGNTRRADEIFTQYRDSALFLPVQLIARDFAQKASALSESSRF